MDEMTKNKSNSLRAMMKKRIVLLDGAMGTQLYQRGMPQGVSPELWAIKNKKLVADIHKDYFSSGADIVYTCSFGANKVKLLEYGCKDVFAVNKKLAEIAKASAMPGKLVAGDIGPTGKFVAPFGDMPFEEAVLIFKQQVRGLLAGGVDLFVVETMMDIQEARAALIAVKELTNKFTIVTLTYEKTGRTLNGTDPVTALITLQSLGADAVGCNCSLGPQEMISLIKKMKRYSIVPLVAKPNAGMPRLSKGVTSFKMSPDEFSLYAKQLIKAGANFIGGCCGSTPEHILKLNKTLKKQRPVLPLRKKISAISSSREHVILENNIRPIVVGECINPTGKKLLQEELCKGKMSQVRSLAVQQQSSGALALDVNVGVAGIDEKKTLEKVISVLSLHSKLPLVIDSSSISAVEKALRFYPGRALINSISGERKKLKKLLPIAAKYGAMFIILPMNDKEVPKTFKRRREIIKHVLNQARRFNFSKSDIVVDGLIMTVSSYPHAAVETLKTIFWAAHRLKTNTICGLSNISFGMPERQVINSTFFTLLKRAGLSMVISNPAEDTSVYNRAAEKVLRAEDKNARAYIDYCQRVKQIKRNKKSINESSGEFSVEKKIFSAITRGNREDISAYVKMALALKIKPDFLVNKIMIPAINKVGDLFDRKVYFLPQLIASAETMKRGVEVLKPLLKREKMHSQKKNVVILATVRGDMHDIGKNIISLMLENYGFSVIDLGKDVRAVRIINEIRKHNTPIVGLSALMTTTMLNMQEIIKLARKKKLDCRFIVGGAVITKKYADSIGAGYAKDGIEAVRLLESMIKNR